MIDLQGALRLYLVADPEHCDSDLIDKVDSALKGGVTMVQLRAKHLSDLEAVNLATTLRALCSRHGVPFVVNDRVDIALAAGADGVHLGVDDLPLEAARAMTSDRFIIGYSPESDDQLRLAVGRGANYLGIGPVFNTTTKADAGEPLGPEGVAARIRLTKLPIVGIGGITAESFRAVLNTGAAGVAVVSAILRANDAELAARQFSRN